ncbi:MAG TPA: hypothetical protein VHM25_05605 [Polyangiaceae bacterium]|nr:hypothetical protein [Polyangiaceae bacterium]
MRSPTRSAFGVAGVLLAAALLFAQSARARVGGDSEYSKAQTYSGALRYLRVDLGYEVVERDPDAAYLIFRYQPPGQNKGNATGTVEIVDTDGHVKLFVQIPSMPEYHERVLRDGLVRKLHDEYGIPPRKPAPPPPPQKKPEGDAGTD